MRAFCTFFYLPLLCTVMVFVQAAVLQANEDAAKIMQARRDAYEKMRAEEAERQAQVDAEAARQRKKEELLKEKMRRRLER